MQFVCVVLR